MQILQKQKSVLGADGLEGPYPRQRPHTVRGLIKYLRAQPVLLPENLLALSAQIDNMLSIPSRY